MNTARQDKARLLATAQEIAERLRPRSAGTKLRIRRPSRTSQTNTGGWSAVIGNLGHGQPRLEIWFDLFSGYPGRKFYAGFVFDERRPVTRIVDRVRDKHLPARTVSNDDLIEGHLVQLEQRLKREEFNEAVLETYKCGHTFFGIYDPTRETKARVSLHFCDCAAAFFLDGIQSLPTAASDEDTHEVYPQCENRQRVVSHLHRERSSYLAAQRKERDDYTCQVCGLSFEQVYGRLGRGFAEAHHVVPLSQLDGEVKTRLEDLTTVCANCHRMLHRMSGQRGDVAKLKAIVARHVR